MCENNVEPQWDNIKQIIEAKVIKALQVEEYTLNTVNSYGESLLHISAANDCINIVKEILQKWDSNHVIDRKNKFGWTPLMLAIRNRNVETVKILLKRDVNVNQSTYLGMSVFGLAAAINKDMFETVYEAYPSALSNCMNDDITPLCIAAMKNDKDLFFRLLELGFEISKSNEYTQIMMKQSIIPEIKNLAKKHLDVENYWNDISDNIRTEHNLQNRCNTLIKTDNNNIPSLNIHFKPTSITNSSEYYSKECNNNTILDSKKYLKPCALNLISKQLECIPHSLISPTLTYAIEHILPQSPSMYFLQNKHNEKSNFDTIINAENKQPMQIGDAITYSKNNNDLPKAHLQRLQSVCPPKLNIQNEPEDLDTTLGYVPEFSPLRSPNVPQDIDDENVFGENTPTPPRYKTPPRGMILNSEEAKMFVLLKQYGLSQHIPIFLQQEIDVDLFAILTDEDLIEIGINNESDRKVILSVIKDYRESII